MLDSAIVNDSRIAEAARNLTAPPVPHKTAAAGEIHRGFGPRAAAAPDQGRGADGDGGAAAGLDWAGGRAGGGAPAAGGGAAGAGAAPLAGAVDVPAGGA